MVNGREATKVLSTSELDTAGLADLAMAAGEEADDLLRGQVGQIEAIRLIDQAIRQASDGPLSLASRTLEKGFCGHVARQGYQSRCLEAVASGSRLAKDLAAVREICFSLHDALMAGPVPQSYLIWSPGSSRTTRKPKCRTRASISF